ncbi:MAG: hypothetical protein OJF49_001964 [Ktedonobacterales bacterium]|nr:MAG: hypothetical protein OJF49_001964 [Ktedonobacterales bacterium]
MRSTTQRRIIKDSGRWYAGFIAAQRARHTQTHQRIPGAS